MSIVIPLRNRLPTLLISRVGQLPKSLLSDFADVFSDKLQFGLHASRETDRRIEILHDSLPLPHRVYRMQFNDLPVLELLLREYVDAGHISPTTSPCGAEVLLVVKKDLVGPLVVVYRQLNKVTVKYVSPLPRIDATIDRFAGATMFTRIDLLQ